MSSIVTRPTIFQPYLPSPAYAAGFNRQRPISKPALLNPQKVQDRRLPGEATQFTGGLRTPPADDMSTTYHQQHPHHLASTYDSHVALARHPGAIPVAGRPAGYFSDALPHSARIQPPQQNAQYAGVQSIPVNSMELIQGSNSRHSTRPSSPLASSTTAPASVSSQAESGTLSRRESTMVMHSLRLPSCISPNGGNLDDFAALMTCFFWFETMDTIQAAEKSRERPSSERVSRLSQYTVPCPQYKKWVNSILSTTQVTQNVILLALLFVYRLKRSNPKVNGSPGSEYRLLTVALMLGNKFLDDNTYTNKTWAEVSGISVKEIHVMEVEFLSNMRYGLLTSKDQWEKWLDKLACFYEYTERAQAMAPTPLSIPSPSHRPFVTPLPSPTTVLPSTAQHTPQSLTTFSPNNIVFNSNPVWQPQFQPTHQISPLDSKPNLNLPTVTRKRSLEGADLSEPAAKRMSRQNPTTLATMSRPVPGQSEPIRLPVPHLTLDTSQAGPTPTYTPNTNYGAPPQQQQQQVSLPPLGPSVRAMSTVYSTPVTTWAQQMPLMATAGPQTPAFSAPSHYSTPTKRSSPTSLAPFGSSPLAEMFQSHTPMSNSPSVYLQQRQSPYKPVRRVNTLLNPAPSMPLDQYHLGSAQMHYQPIGRRNDVRTGIVPEFQTYSNPNLRHLPVTQTPSHF